MFKLEYSNKTLTFEDYLIREEIRNLDIPEHTSNMDSNVNIGETFTIDPSTILPLPSSPLVTFVIQTSTAPTHSPTFDRILRQPITKLFLSQSLILHMIKGLVISQQMDDEDKGFNFGTPTFDSDKDDTEDEDIISKQQYNILNYVMNMIL